MKAKLHAIIGAVAFLTILTFWSSTVISELFGSPSTIASVKHAILWGMLLLIPSMMGVGASGMMLGKGRSDTLVLRKKKRMPIIALNGLLILVPAAFFLAAKSAAGEFDTLFYVVQVIELLAGATNLTLMGLNIRDGLYLTGKLSNPNNTQQNTDKYPLVTVISGGPLLVSGLDSIIDTNQQTIPTKSPIRLCRCGASKNKPFCDGSHTTIGFKG